MTVFGKYQVVEQIGQGGFGRVYRGWDPILKREVAIKAVTLSAPQARERFVREAEIAANLRHPHIVTVFDYGEQDGQPYLVQEFLPGWDLEELIRSGSAGDLRTRLSYLVQAAEALHYAHWRGVVHRDVKPGNLRVLADGTLRVMDFGIAKILDAGADLTATGMSIGTSGYLAPEQLEGLPIDHRADIFSFGVVAYELLTGTKPFPGDTLSAVLYRILHEEPAAIGTLAPGSPPRLVACIERCLRKRRDDRFDDLSQVAAELRAVMTEVETLPSAASWIAPAPMAAAPSAPSVAAASESASPLSMISPPVADVARSVTQVLAGTPANLPTPSMPGSSVSSAITRAPAVSSVVSPAAATTVGGPPPTQRVSVMLAVGLVAVVVASMAFYFRGRPEAVETASADSAAALSVAMSSQPDSTVGTGNVELDTRTAVTDAGQAAASAAAAAAAAAAGGSSVAPDTRTQPQAGGADSLRAPATASTVTPQTQRPEPGAVGTPGRSRSPNGTERRAAVLPPTSSPRIADEAPPSAREAVTTDRNRVVVFLRGANGSAVELAEQTLVSELTSRGRTVLSRDNLTDPQATAAARRVMAGGDARAAGIVGRSVGAVTVMVGTLTVDAAESVPGIITGSALLDARFYDGTTGALLAAERFQVGAGGVPGRAGISALDAISQAAESVARQAVRALAQRSGSER